jgi:hypothetical protein
LPDQDEEKALKKLASNLSSTRQRSRFPLRLPLIATISHSTSSLVKCSQLSIVKVGLYVHAVVQDADDLNAVLGSAVENQVSPNMIFAIPRPNIGTVATALRLLR